MFTASLRYPSSRARQTLPLGRVPEQCCVTFAVVSIYSAISRTGLTDFVCSVKYQWTSAVAAVCGNSGTLRTRSTSVLSSRCGSLITYAHLAVRGHLKPGFASGACFQSAVPHFTCLAGLVDTRGGCARNVLVGIPTADDSGVDVVFARVVSRAFTTRASISGWTLLRTTTVGVCADDERGNDKRELHSSDVQQNNDSR